jgi:hypothetical protein
MESGRIGRGRQTRRSPLADAFFIALAGGLAEARSRAQSLAGAAQVDMAAFPSDHDDAASEALDYMVHSGLLWRLRPDGGQVVSWALVDRVQAAEFPMAQRGPKWHTAPERRWLIPAL